MTALSSTPFSAPLLNSHLSLYSPTPRSPPPPALPFFLKASTWKRTPCGAPAPKPAPPGAYETGIDYAGNDITGNCGSGAAFENGCVLAATATHLDCETKCNATKACVLYVFAPQDCSGQAGPVCWVKNAVGHPSPKTACRNSRIVGTGGKPAGVRALLPLNPVPISFKCTGSVTRRFCWDLQLSSA